MPAAGGFGFGPFLLDPRAKRLTRDGADVPIAPRPFILLHALVSRAGETLGKDPLIQAAWPDVIVGDNNLEQAISQLRRLLDATQPHRYIETVPRRGYRFVAPVTRVTTRASDAVLRELVAPWRALVEGRAAIESLDRHKLPSARSALERALASHPDDATLRVALANVCVLQFETTRAEASPDRDALGHAAGHAREACRLDPDYGEAWATLGFVLERTSERAEALVALERSVRLEPDNWRHTLRLSAGSWGERRLRAARRTLALMPGLALAHGLAATVYVARHLFAEAGREIEAGLAAASIAGASRFSAVALYWLEGLLCLARGDDERALGWLERELAEEARGHLYSRECCANAWYAVGAVHLRQGDHPRARSAFAEAVARVPGHAMAQAGVMLIERGERYEVPAAAAADVDVAMARAVRLVAEGDSPGAARLVASALAVAPDGNAGWLLPLDPLLGVSRAPDAWAPALAALRMRAV
ncbi:MAG: winged helix-turn-helix domain-containing protein [Acidobacteria bacterium]|nr:winged helix-turn-helix domain-containing protein [Acidobacteriota bacterium]